jgi:hypothetical protein
MTTTRLIGIAAVVVFVLVGVLWVFAASADLSDEDYVLICESYRRGAMLNRGPAVALGFTMEHFHMDHHTAAVAVDTARREHCP